MSTTKPKNNLEIISSRDETTSPFYCTVPSIGSVTL
jgi:hypothetical protein